MAVKPSKKVTPYKLTNLPSSSLANTRNTTTPTHNTAFGSTITNRTTRLNHNNQSQLTHQSPSSNELNYSASTTAAATIITNSTNNNSRFFL